MIENKAKMSLPWDERVPMLSINPDAASRHDVAEMAANLMKANSENLLLRTALEPFAFRSDHGPNMAPHQNKEYCYTCEEKIPCRYMRAKEALKEGSNG